MNTTISNNGLPGGLPPATGSSKKGGNAASTAAPAHSGSAASGAEDQLKLTDSARALQQASLPSDASTVNAPKVAQIKQSLADGSYQINPAKIADRMTAMDRQARGTGKP